jgi:hypothetical protein
MFTDVFEFDTEGADLKYDVNAFEFLNLLTSYTAETFNARCPCVPTTRTRWSFAAWSYFWGLLLSGR